MTVTLTVSKVLVKKCQFAEAGLLKSELDILITRSPSGVVTCAKNLVGAAHLSAILSSCSNIVMK